ncbi:hypothetical protein PP631_gp096 [Streptomyces phage KimJongPhill]|uniref:Uncharacterized protein n=1 Tax=Streptomyces phage KimJongPhill TaxID=2848886 RepID=A0A8F2E6R8_9CAUD|nr:hypothetical protein PP631_gp096 [Streptomyces phage KimJongPhill]QWT29877.1 hypothetical protein SEA_KIMJONGPHILL_96 [Streptomyces phage KimJongPhill]
MSEIIVREMTDVTPTCALCGFVIEDIDLSEETARGLIHFDRQCPKGAEKKAKPARKTAPAAPKKSPERVLAEGAGIVVKEMKIVGVRGAHAECDHAATKSARAACRKAKAAAAK